MRVKPSSALFQSADSLAIARESQLGRIVHNPNDPTLRDSMFRLLEVRLEQGLHGDGLIREESVRRFQLGAAPRLLGEALRWSRLDARGDLLKSPCEPLVTELGAIELLGQASVAVHLRDHRPVRSRPSSRGDHDV